MILCPGAQSDRPQDVITRTVVFNWIKKAILKDLSPCNYNIKIKIAAARI